MLLKRIHFSFVESTVKIHFTKFISTVFCFISFAFIGISQYCTPGVTSTVEPITLVTFSNINNSTPATGTPGYQDFSAMIGNVTAGTAYALTIKGNTGGNNTNYIRAYFDWNNNGDFLGTNESYDLGTIVNSNGTDAKTASLSITIPTCDIASTVRMRIVKSYLAYTSGPCSPVSYGQIEDYTLNVTNTGTIISYTVTGGNPNMPNAPVGLSGSQTGVTYQLQKNGVAVGTPIQGTGNALNFGNQGAGIYTVLAYENGNQGCPKTMNGNVIVAVAIFDYTGADQTYSVPTCGTKIRVHIWGAGGGGGDAIKQYTTLGGGGGYVTGEMTVTPNENLTIVVGSGGTFPASNNPYGGGGIGGGSLLSGNGSAYTGNGGGRTAIIRGTTELATAGGGGGGGETSGSGDRGGYGGAGGGTTGIAGYHTATTAGNRGGKGGTQLGGGAGGTGSGGASTAGIAFKGGNGGFQNSGSNRREGGGGGGGYYGGGGGAADNNQGGGGGGGSSYLGAMSNASTLSNSVANGEAANQNHEYNKGMFGRGGLTNASGNPGRIVIEVIEVDIHEPIIGTITQTTCTDSASVVLTGLPSSGNWTLTRNPDQKITAGSGTTYTVTGLVPNTTYSWSVTNANGCTSDNSADVVIDALPIITDPIVNVTNSTCTAPSSASISNYNTSWIYVFSPVGPTVDNSGAISGMTVGTSYTVKASKGICESGASNSFISSDQLPAPDSPIIAVVAPDCNNDGSASISNHNSSTTYSFSPTGPTIDSNGGISGLTVGVSYTVKAIVGTCESAISNPFTINAQTPAPTAPTVTSPQTFCGTTMVSNLTPSTSDYKWYNTPSGGVALGSNEIITTGTYYVSQIIGTCESNRVAVNATVNPIPTIVISTDKTICKGDKVTLTASGADSYTWTPMTDIEIPTGGNGSTVIATPTSTITYTVSGTTNGCSSTANVTVTVLNLPIASFTSSVDSGYAPLNVIFTNTSVNATSYTWDINNTLNNSSTNFSNTFETEGNYTVTLIASNGVCSDTTNKVIHAILVPPIYIVVPNVFTPNGDGNNDELFVTAQGVKEFKLEIFNRWGNPMYQFSGLSDKWDGKDATDGTYFYKYQAKGENDVLTEGQGFFHLVR